MIIGLSGKKQSGKDTVAKMIQYLVTKDRIEAGVLKTSLYSRIEGYLESSDGKHYVRETESGWQTKMFAEKLKQMVCLLIGCTMEQLEDKEFKNKELGEEWAVYNWSNEESNTPLFLSREEALAYHGEYAPITKRILTPRLLLQLLGTECGRKIIHPNIWVNTLMSEYKPLVSTQGVLMNLGMSTSQLEKIGKEIPIEYPNWIITDVRFPNEVKAIESKGGVILRIDRPGIIRTDEHESEVALDNYGFTHELTNNGTLDDLYQGVVNFLEYLKSVNLV